MDVEILAPAGNEECAIAAINSGADAVYLGYSAFSARDGAENFDDGKLESLLKRAKLLGVKVYVAMNTLVKSEEKEVFLNQLIHLWNMGVDAIIMQDILLGKYVKEYYPSVCLHLSTQAGVCSVEGAVFAKECGFSRVILARETPLSEIEKIAKVIETEAFVQGALCTAFSGECYFSSFVGGNSGNRGRCKQPCRKKYTIDRKGYDKKEYALSLSDLSVGEWMDKLLQSGVTSLKIEGRMRRAEYVAAAVSYYRSLLDGKEDINKRLSDLKRTYNRGNYTKGLAFSQDKRFLSRNVQGHLGEKVGVVKVVGGKFLVESGFTPQKGDAFKILRNGQEVGGAYQAGSWQRGFVLSSKNRLMNGDLVFITTDEEVKNRLLSKQEKGKISLRIRFEEKGYGVVEGGGVFLSTKDTLATAQSAPLTQKDLKDCFLKTDGLPIEVLFEKVETVGNIFIPKSLLNAFRREFYEKLTESLLKREKLSLVPLEEKSFVGKNNKVAVITTGKIPAWADIAVLKKYAFDEQELVSFRALGKELYLYYPPFTTAEERNAFKKTLALGVFDGIYAENYGGIVFAKEVGCRVFAGTGLNLSNEIALCKLLEFEFVSYYAISKELSEKESQLLLNEKGFALCTGDLKLMDLCYCPFEKTCFECDKREVYSLTDENNRSFPLRREVRADGACRFEVYNCASLVGNVKGVGRLMDLTLTGVERDLSNLTEEEQKEFFKKYTQGHRYKSVT